MQLIGLLDSPYVRRVAVSLQLMGLPFEHRALSVFRNFDEFRAINPLVKAPTLVCDDGSLLLDSTLIVTYAEALPGCRRRLRPAALPALQRCLRLAGLALAACEKAVQVVYEQNLRPPDKVHAPWLERVSGQMLAGFALLERELASAPLAASSATIDDAGVCVATTWHFTQQMLAEAVPAASYPALRDFSIAAEALPEFRAVPHGLGTYRG